MNRNSTKPKVLFLGKTPPPYIGPTIATEIILNSKITDSFELIHFDISDHRSVDTLARIDFVNIWLAIKQYFLLIFYIIKYKPQLVYIPAGQTKVGYLRDSIFMLIPKIFRKKLLCHLRGGNFYNFYSHSSYLMKWYIRSVHGLVDGQIVLGNNLRYLFNWIVPDENIYVVPNGGNFPIPAPNKGDKIYILYLGNFIRSKGIIDVLNAFANLTGHDNLELHLAGDWNEPETKKEIDEFLDNHDLPIYLHGAKSGLDKFELYSKSSLFVFPTYYINEGHPWVIVEAMAAGLPIISTDHGAIKESVLEGVNGYLVEKQNSKQLSEKIQFLLDHPKILDKMGKESRRLYEENYTEEKMIAKLTAAFNSVLNN